MGETIVFDESVQKMIAEVVSGLKETSTSSAKLAETINMTQDEDKKWKAQLAEIVTAVKPVVAKPADAPAPLKESIGTTVKSATKEVVPVVIGGVASIFFTELIDGIYTNMGKGNIYKGVTKAAVAVVVWKWGDKIPFMGKTGKNIAAALIAFDALRSLVPAIPNMVSGAANKLSGAVPVGGLGGQRTGEINRGGVMRQANQILSSSQRMAMR
jgi:hypothetical protein